jgi:hypothetical protein
MRLEDPAMTQLAKRHLVRDVVILMVGAAALAALALLGAL